MSPVSAFPNYTQLPRRVPLRVWHAVRVLSVAAALALVVVLVTAPRAGLFVFWGLLVPLLPLVFFLAPGLWRNVCPLAALNQTPRVLGISRAKPVPRLLREHGYLLGVGLFLVIVPSRKVLFDDHGPALAALLFATMAAAFVGGLLIKGKGGWCSSMCPLLPVQRLYGQTPFALVPNSHCQPCVGCAKNCYDFNPQVAYLADQYDSDRTFPLRRRFFAGAFPGLVLAFFVVPDPPDVPVATMYGLVALALLASAGSFFVLDALVPARPGRLTALYAALALNLFYWFNAPLLLARLGVDADWPAWAARAVVLALTGVWIVRTFRTEVRFVAEAATNAPVKVAGAALSRRPAAAGDRPEVTVAGEDGDDRRIVVDSGAVLLDVLERSGTQIEAGCRMGVCGADPVAVLDGADHCSPVGSDEQDTLDRLGFSDNTRMACCVRVSGPISVSLTPEKGQARRPTPALPVDPAITDVVVVGNGIAGVTAADHVRRNHPDCTIHLVGREAHQLYNRMAISRLIYGRSAMQGLYLLPDEWYAEHGITTWLNTQATRIDRERQQVTVGTGEVLDYSRLILAMGSRSVVPELPGAGLPGVFVLREAGDAMGIRAYVQEHAARRAVVAGGGLLGIEAAYALVKLGLAVTVLERSATLLRRQLDRRAAELLVGYLDQLGIDVLVEAVLARGEPSGGELREVLLADGRRLDCDILVVCAGIQPNAELAAAAGLVVERGVVVDDHMRTSDPLVFAAGDVAQHRGEVVGLWPPAARQAEVAARNALGGDERYEPAPPLTLLKVVGVDLASVGRVHEREGDQVVVHEDVAEHRYRKLVVDRGGHVVGAILLGHPDDAAVVTAAVQRSVNAGGHVDALRAGDLRVLTAVPDPV